MRKIVILMMAILLCLSCASMTPEEKQRKERLEIYRLYLNTGMRDDSLTDEEVKKLDELKSRYNRYDGVIWQ
jgi:uncharacterized protein YcfL